jgi:hypothetical protein
MIQACCQRCMLAIAVTILLGVASGVLAAEVSFDQLLSITATCTIEGQAPIVHTAGLGQWNGCSDGVLGTETMAIIDRRLPEVMNLLFAVGNFPCSGTQIVTWRTGDQQPVCTPNSGDPGGSPQDALAAFHFVFPEMVALSLDVSAFGVVTGTTQLTVNGVPAPSSGVVHVTAQDFTVEIFVSKEAPGQIVGDIIARIASITDTDGDGVLDTEDACPTSDVRPGVIIDGCDARVVNKIFGDGCTIADLITNCADEAKNHGQFVRCVTDVSDKLRDMGAISNQQRGALQRCAAQRN